MANRHKKGFSAAKSGDTGSKVMKEAKEKTSGFKEGGKVEGKACGGRLDKRARGGGVMSSAGGGSADKRPFSSAKIGK
jgi:hypothetical protein